MPETMEMKVSMKKGIGFYMRSATAFLKGIEAKPAEPAEGEKPGRPAVEAKAPVDELKISGLGDAINTAIASAARVEADGLGKITKVETAYPEMTEGRGCAQIMITVKKI